MRRGAPPTGGTPPLQYESGGVLLSHTVSHAVPSALKSLTTGFGMGPGVSPSPKPPNDQRTTPTRGRQTNDSLINNHGLGRVCFLRTTQGREHHTTATCQNRIVCQATRPISTGQLHTLPRFHTRPINPIVYRGPYTHKGVGELILRKASRLDAFSGYPDRT